MPPARLHLRRLSGDARDRVDRMAEQIAVVNLRAAAELAHRVTELGVDERVDHHGGPALRAVDGELKIVDALDARMADDVELRVGELGLERGDEAGGGLARGVRHDVQLDDVVAGHRQEDT